MDSDSQLLEGCTHMTNKNCEKQTNVKICSDMPSQHQITQCFPSKVLSTDQLCFCITKPVLINCILDNKSDMDENWQMCDRCFIRILNDLDSWQFTNQAVNENYF